MSNAQPKERKKTQSSSIVVFFSISLASGAVVVVCPMDQLEVEIVKNAAALICFSGARARAPFESRAHP